MLHGLPGDSSQPSHVISASCENRPRNRSMDTVCHPRTRVPTRHVVAAGPEQAWEADSSPFVGQTASPVSQDSGCQSRQCSRPPTRLDPSLILQTTLARQQARPYCIGSHWQGRAELSHQPPLPSRALARRWPRSQAASPQSSLAPRFVTLVTQKTRAWRGMAAADAGISARPPAAASLMARPTWPQTGPTRTSLRCALAGLSRVPTPAIWKYSAPLVDVEKLLAPSHHALRECCLVSGSGRSSEAKAPLRRSWHQVAHQANLISKTVSAALISRAPLYQP